MSLYPEHLLIVPRASSKKFLSSSTRLSPVI